MSRLTERCRHDETKVVCVPIEECDAQCGKCKLMNKMMQKLADYEDKEEKGLMILLPVTIGETVYRINEYAENPIIQMAVTSFEIKGITNTFKKIRCKELGFGGEWTYRFTDIGKTLFITRSEAEAALAKMGGNE